MTWLLPERLSENVCRKFGWLILLLVAAALYLPGLGVLPLMDRDEPRFAHATVEMMNRGSWAVPYFNEEYRFDKPPLTYWWMSLHYRLLGVSEFAARLHTVIATWLVVVVIAGIGRRWFNARAGLCAGLLWLTTLQVLIHGRLCVADMPMVLCVTLAMRALMEILLPEGGLISAAAPKRWSCWHWLLYGALGLGFLAKGPIALLVPALALVLFRFVFWREPVPWGHLYPLRGLLLALVIVGAWGVPALIETKGQFWKVGMGEHVIDRGTRALNGRIPFPGYYLATALVSLFPWIAFLPQTWSAVRRRYNPVLALLVCWFFAPYLIFTFYATQLPHYVMPGFPAAMVLLVLPDQPYRKHTWWALLVVGLWLVLAAALWVLTQGFAWPDGLASVVQSGAWVCTALAIFGALMVGAVRFQSRKACLVALVALCFVPLSVDVLCGSIRNVHAAALLSGDAKTLPGNTEFIACQFTEPSLVFHFDRTWRFTGNVKTLDDRLNRRGSHYALMLRREWTMSDCLRRAIHRESFATASTDLSKEVEALTAAHPDYAARRVSVFNAARASWAELVVLSREQ